LPLHNALQFSPHSVRHSAITFAQLGRGASCATCRTTPAAGPRTTRRYNHSRDSLDRNAADIVAAYLA
jgi:hypothetical protein